MTGGTEADLACARAAPTTVVFDLGGVLIDWNPRYLYRRLLPADEVEPFLDEVDFMAWNHLQDSGGRWTEAVDSHAEQHPTRRHLLAAYPDRFPESMNGPIRGTVEILHQLDAEGVRLLALTNWSAELFPHALRTFDFLQVFQDILVSGVEGVAKPDPAVFALLLDRYGLDAAATAFIDDSPTNVAAAAAAGLQALHFRDPGRLRAELSQLGLLTSGPGQGTGSGHPSETDAAST